MEPTWWWIMGLLISSSMLFLWYRKRWRKKKKAESKLSVFEHPSNFKKPPIEWVQNPKTKEKDNKTKKLTL